MNLKTFIADAETDAKDLLSKISNEFRPVTQEAISILGPIEDCLDIVIAAFPGAATDVNLAEGAINKFVAHVSSGGVVDSAAALTTEAQTAAIKEAEAKLPAASTSAITTAIGLVSGAITKQIAAAQAAAAPTSQATQ